MVVIVSLLLFASNVVLSLHCIGDWLMFYNISSFVGYLMQNPVFVLVGRVFTNGSGDRVSIPGRVIPKNGTKYFLA